MPLHTNKLILLTALLLFPALTCVAQSTSGTVSMSATVSKFVEINSGGTVTLTGNSGGGVTTDGVANSPLAVSINLGELGPSNTNSFVSAQVPLKLRSNAPYVLSMTGTVTSSGTTASRIVASDVGFGLGTVSRTGVGVNAGADTNATSGDPTVGGSTDANGRWVFAGANSTLGAYSVSGAVLNGPRINQAVSANSNTALTFPAIFAVKPQFFDPAPAITITAQFTVVAL